MARYRRYYVDSKKDGSVRVFSTGPFLALARIFYPLFLLVIFIAFIQALIAGHIGDAGVILLVFAIFLPNFKKVKKHA